MSEVAEVDARHDVHVDAAETPPRRARLVRLPRRMRFLTYLAIAGPGLIAANAGNDAGGIATYASAGSQYRYRTLFFMVLVTVGSKAATFVSVVQQVLLQGAQMLLLHE